MDDFTVFVPGAMEGESGLIKIVKVNKNFAFGKIINLDKISENRVEPICSIYKHCGGCKVQHYNYKSQLKIKKTKGYRFIKKNR